MRGLLITILAWLILLGVANAESGQFLGLTMPELETDQENWILPDDTVFKTLYPITREAILYLSGRGSVDSIAYDTMQIPNYIRSIKKSLSNLKFKPGRIFGKKSSIVYPVNLNFFSYGRNAGVKIVLPYDYIQNIVNYTLIEKTLMANDFQLPGLTRFPQYYYKINPDSITTLYDFAVYEVILDSSGRAEDLIEVVVSDKKMSEVFTIAARYADFHTTEYNDRKYPSRIFLTARIFNNIQYPTDPWPPENNKRQNAPFDFVRLETSLWPDTLISPAYPLNFGGEFGSKGILAPLDSIPVEIIVNSKGAIGFKSYRVRLSADYKNKLDEIMDKLLFVPAIDINGKQVEFRGSLLVTRTNSNKLRINAKWINPEYMKKSQ